MSYSFNLDNKEHFELPVSVIRSKADGAVAKVLLTRIIELFFCFLL